MAEALVGGAIFYSKISNKVVVINFAEEGSEEGFHYLQTDSDYINLSHFKTMELKVASWVARQEQVCGWCNECEDCDDLRLAVIDLEFERGILVEHEGIDHLASPLKI